MRNFGELGVHVGNCRRDIRSPVVAGHAILRRRVHVSQARAGTAQQPWTRQRVMRHMTGDAGILRYVGIAPEDGSIGNLVAGGRMDADGPLRERIVLSIDGSRIARVASQAHLSIGAVADQEILRKPIYGLHMRRMATGALHIVVHQLHSFVGISRGMGAGQRLL